MFIPQLYLQYAGHVTPHSARRCPDTIKRRHSSAAGQSVGRVFNVTNCKLAVFTDLSDLPLVGICRYCWSGMTHRRSIFWGWFLALTVMVTAALPHMSFASPQPDHSEGVHQIVAASNGCDFTMSSDEKTGGCAAMTAHCSSLLPQPVLLPRQARMQISVEYGFGVVAPYNLASVSETPPPRA
jgi:hypothetical protein